MDSAEEVQYFSTVHGSVSDINFCYDKNSQGNPPIGSFKNSEFVPLTDSACRFLAACSLDGRKLPSNLPNFWNLCSTGEGFFSFNSMPATPRHNPFPKSAAGVEKDTNVVCDFAPFTPDLSAKRLQNAQSPKSTSVLYDEKLKGGGNDGSCQHNVDLSIEEKGVPPSASVFLPTQLMEKANIDMADHHLRCIDLNKTPPVVKPRRKKHRPKVVGESKRKQSPIVVTCDQARNKVTKTYMRKRPRKGEDPSRGNVEEGTVQSVGTTVDLKTSSVQSVGATVGLETFRIGDLNLNVADQAEKPTNILDIEILSKGDGQCGSCQPNAELFSEEQVATPSASAFSFTPLKDMRSMDMEDLHRRDVDLNKTPPLIESRWKKNWSTLDGEGKLKSPNLVIPQQDGNKEMKTYLRKRSSLGQATPQANAEEGAVQSAKAREGLKTAGRQSLNFNLEEEGVVHLVRAKQSLKTSCRRSLDFNFVDEPGRPTNTMADEILSKGDGQDGGCQPNVEVFGEEQLVPQGASFFSFTPLKDAHNMYTGDLHKSSIDLTKTPPMMNPRRKKHRPKVIGEGKPKKSPKVLNPDQAGDKDVKTYRRERSSNGKVTPHVDVEEGAVQSERTRVGLETSCRRVLNLNVDDQPGGLNYVGSCTLPPDLVASSRSSLMDQKLEVVNSGLSSCNSMGYITKGLKRKSIETISTDHIEPGIIQDNRDYFPLISKKKRSNGRRRIGNCEKLWNVSQTIVRSCSFTSLYEINHFTTGFEVCMEALRTLNQATPRKNRTKKSCRIHVAQPLSSPIEVVPSEPIGENVEICLEMIELLLSSSVSEVSVKALETQNQATPRKKRTMKGHPHILANSVSNSTSIVPWEPISEVVHSDERMLTLLEAQNALVPYGEHAVIIKKKKKPRAKVYLDEDTNRVWAQLMWKEESQETEDEDNKEKWKEERQIFHGRVDSFIARMRFVQGERRFSRWKGSVVDSVVGVFLTQNVSDHLSSSAFMALVSRFQLQSRTNCGNTAERAKNSPEEPKVSTVDIEKWQDKLLNQGLSDQGSMTMHEYGFVEEEMEHSIESVANNVGLCTTDYSKDKQTIICENGQKMTQESEEDRTYIARELEDVISENSTGLNFNIADKTGLVSESNPEVVNVVFKELLQMQEEKMFNELNHHGNRSLQSDLTVEGANTIELSSESSSEAENVVNRFKSYQFMDLLQMQEHKVFPEMNHQGNMSLQSDVTVEGVDVENTVSSFDGGQSASGLSTHLATLCHTPQKQEDTLNTSKNMTLADPESVEVSADEIISSLSSTASEILQIKHSTSVEKTNGPGVENATEFMDLPPCSQCDSCAPESELRAHLSPEPEFRVLEPADQMQDSRIQTCLPNFNILGETVGVREWSRLVDTETTIKGNKVESSSKDEPHSFKKGAAETAKNKVKGKVTKNGAKPDNIDWDSLRRQAYSKGPRKEGSHDATDTLDYEAIRCSDVNEISDTIKVRGMNNRLAERIKDFLNRLVQDHGSIDLEWLRDVPPDKTKDYLLSIRGLGLKSVECVRLLALHHVAFPVDTNVARICVRLGWVPLEPLPESVQMHLLEMYPFMDSVQKYLWPRLCKLDELTLYELHYQMITFGKVFCTKSKPNCNACPMRGECKHFASAFASARLALPRPEEKGLVTSAVSLTASEQYDKMFANLMPLPPLKRVSYSQEALGIPGSEPIIEEPASPEHGTFHPSEVPMKEIFDASENDIEDAFWEENPDEIPTIKLNMDEFYQNVQKYMQVNITAVQDGDVSKALVALTAAAASIPMPKLKNVSRLRTEHLVYELPDSHTLLKGLDPREPDDICPYLLAIWSPGETAQSTQPHVFSCNSQDTDNLCDKETCYACNTVREANAQTVRGTLLIPCRTAMRGSFPLNGTYFQINEMFADHESSLQPIDVPRTLIWNLPRRTVYFGTSVPTIFRGLTAEEIQLCFWRGFICVRGFDRKTRAPRPLIARLHLPASKQMKTTKGTNRTSEE